jgi:predicted outer membrane repeat protein
MSNNPSVTIRRPARRILAEAIALIVFGTIGAHANTITVTTNADSGAGSLRDAIANAIAGDTINFDPAGLSGGQTIALTSGSLSPPVNMTITGASGPAVSVVNSTSRVFNFTGAGLSAVTLDSLTLQGTASDGSTGGAIRSSTPTTFTLTITNSNINGTLSVATRGGAISITGNNNSLAIDHCTVVGSVGTTGAFNNDAGGIYFAASGATATLTHSIITGTVSGGGSANLGGAIYMNSGTMNVSDTTITGSSVVGVKANGGGIDIQGGTMTLNRVTVSGNGAANNGGGIYVGKGTLNVIDTTISGNTAGAAGGGINAAFYSSNSQNGTAVTNLTNTTISGNTAATADALYVSYHVHGTTTSTNKVTLTNTIVSGGVGRQTGGAITDAKETFNASYSLFDDSPTTGAGKTINGTNTANIVATNPQLGPLQNNGGSTQTQAITLGGPAIDAANNAACPTIDQRGLLRFGNCDIGAFEYQGDRIFADGFD